MARSVLGREVEKEKEKDDQKKRKKESLSYCPGEKWLRRKEGKEFSFPFILACT